MTGRIGSVSEDPLGNSNETGSKRLETEVSPRLPTSGQVLGALVKSLGISDPRLRSKTASRYFSGRLDNRVKDSSRTEIIEAIAETLAGLGLVIGTQTGHEGSSVSDAVTTILQWHVVSWDRMRAFLQPRMMRVFPSHLDMVWQTYTRLASIDLALRVAAQLHLTGGPPAVLDFLDWISVDRRGAYLNDVRSQVGVSLNALAEAVGVHENTVEAWMYLGARPSNKNLAKIAIALASEDEPSQADRIARELTVLYWTSDVAVVLDGVIGPEAVNDLTEHLRRYVPLLHGVIESGGAGGESSDVLSEIVTFGAHAPSSEQLLTTLASYEEDSEWREDILGAASDWTRRVLTVNLRVHRVEEDALIQETEGQILQKWDVGNPKAYAHYQRSMELQVQGKLHEAISEVAKAVELDPLDPANHFTLGSVKGGIGVRKGDEALVNEGIQACWMAVALDPSWVLPWAEIGWILLQSGRPQEALDHLRNIRSECRSLDSRYYTALAAALREMGQFAESLRAFESSLELDPDDPNLATAAAEAALLAGNREKSNRYAKIARHLGASEGLTKSLELMETMRTKTTWGAQHDREVSASKPSIHSGVDIVNMYLHRARDHFVNGQDVEAIAAVDSVLRLEADNVPAYLLRGIIYGYMNQYDEVISDMTQVIRLDPENALAHYYRGMAYGDQDDLDSAIADLDEAIRLKLETADVYRVRGDCHRYRGEYDTAIADYDLALEVDPENALSYRGRGAAYRMKREPDRAIADYNSAVRLNSNDPFAYRFRGDAYTAKGDYASAVSDFSVALEFNPDDDVAYFGRGNAYLFNGELDLAISDLNAALERNPNSARAYYCRGLAHELARDAEAAEDYRRARQLGYDDSSDG